MPQLSERLFRRHSAHSIGVHRPNSTSARMNPPRRAHSALKTENAQKNRRVFSRATLRLATAPLEDSGSQTFRAVESFLVSRRFDYGKTLIRGHESTTRIRHFHPKGDGSGIIVRDRRFCQRLLIPPSITSSLPTVKAASSEARKTTAWAISPGSPKRPAGIWLWTEAAIALRSASAKPSLP